MPNITLNGIQVDVPEGTTILNAAKQVGIEVLFSYDDLRDIPCTPVSGRYEPADALSHLLRGTGFIARRIVCWKKVGDSVQKGDRVGLIKFGSRVDILMGPDWEIVLSEGQRVSAGSSVVAKRRKL